MQENKQWGRLNSGISLCGMVKPVDFISIEPEKRNDEAAFICPYCDLCLPVLGEKTSKTKYLMAVSKKKHIRVDCKKNHGKVSDLLSYHRDYVKKHSRFERRNSLEQQTARRLEPRMQHARERGHDPALIFMDWSKVQKKVGKCSVVCKSCRREIGCRSGDSVHLPCEGSPENQAGFAPGVAFWQVIQAYGDSKMEEVRDCLGMSQDEIANSLQAVKDFEDLQKMRKEMEIKKKSLVGGNARFKAKFIHY